MKPKSFYVQITFKGYSPELDDKVAKVTRRWFGYEFSGGFCFATNVRDLSIEFKKEHDAQRFCSEIKRNRVFKVKGPFKNDN